MVYSNDYCISNPIAITA